MKGIELAEAYFTKHGSPMLESGFAGCRGRIAAGLVGEGSECFGFDDEVSMDHDWGAAFCLWLEAEDYRTIGRALQQAYQSLPADFMGYKVKEEHPMARGRTGVLSIEGFYQSLIGLNHAPKTLEEWRSIPEYGLSAATNGQVFHDPLGKFTEFRNALKAYYPEDIRLKKIAANCMAMAQTGQYNYRRCIRHGEMLAAQIVLNRFIEAAISMMFLLNKAYKPYYKWMLRSMKGLPVLGTCIHAILEKFWDHTQLPKEKMERYNSYLIEEICSIIIRELKRQGLSDCGSDFLLDHGPCVQRKIGDPWLRSLNVMAD